VGDPAPGYSRHRQIHPGGTRVGLYPTELNPMSTLDHAHTPGVPARLRAEDALLAENALLRERLARLAGALTSIAGDLAESRRETAALIRERKQWLETQPNGTAAHCPSRREGN
jgi:hypothetical protein